MSYTKIYARQFVKIDEKTVLPLVLAGDSNCTMFHNGREINDKSWILYCPDILVGATTSRIRADYENCAKNDMDNREWFKTSNGWVSSSNIMKWFDSGVKGARTIEEIYAKTGNTLNCHIAIQPEKQYTYLDVLNKGCKTTQEILDWLEQAEQYVAPKGFKYIGIQMGFNTIESLGLGKKINENVPVICKLFGTIGGARINRYLNKYTENSICSSPDRSKAIVFDNKKDFEDKMLTIMKKLRVKYALVKANATLPKRNYVIRRIDWEGGYVYRKTSNRVYFTQDTDTAKAFATEQSAQKYIDTKLFCVKARFEPVKVAD